MSTSGAPPGGGRATRAIVLAALAALALALAAANLAQAPRLRSVDVNPQLAVSRDAQRLVLHLNQPVESVSAADIALAPEAPFEATSDGAEVTLRFGAMLDYATDYEVEARVTSAVTGRSGSVRASFSTPDPTVYTLVRSKGGDRLLGHRLTDPGKTRTALEAPRIQGYAILEQGIMAVTRGEGERPELALHPLRPASAVGSAPKPLLVADEMHALRGDARSGLSGVIVSGAGEDGTPYDRALLVFDPASASVTVVADPSGDALPVEHWRFVPGTTSVVVQRSDGRLLLHETWPEERLVDLGATGELGVFLPGTAILTVEANGGERLLDLSGAAAGALDVSALEPEADPPQLARLDAARALAPGVPAATGTGSGRVCLSPNGEFFSVEAIPADAAADGAVGEPGFTGTTTHFVRIDDASTTRSAIGGLSDWCG